MIETKKWRYLSYLGEFQCPTDIICHNPVLELLIFDSIPIKMNFRVVALKVLVEVWSDFFEGQWLVSIFWFPLFDF